MGPKLGPLSLGPSSADWLSDRNSLKVGAGSRGARKIFGYRGDGINGVLGALNRANGKIAFIQARHFDDDAGRTRYFTLDQ